MKRRARHKILGVAFRKKRQREERARPKKKEDIPMTFHRRIRLQMRRCGGLPVLSRAQAPAVPAVLPMVKRTLNRIAYDFAATQIGAQVSAMRVENDHVASVRAIPDDASPGDRFRAGASFELLRSAEQIPRGRRRRKLADVRQSQHDVGRVGCRSL
jgi:hypothetical protein